MIGIGSITDWSIIWDNGKPFVTGIISGHPTFEDGCLIYTSTILAADEKSLVTYSGSCYILSGPPHPQWLKWHLGTNPEFSPTDPFVNLVIPTCKNTEIEIK